MARRDVTITSQGPYTLMISTTSFPESLVPPAALGSITVIDSSYNPSIPVSLGLYGGHEYSVQVRAHDIIGVGTDSNLWGKANWPENGGPTVTSSHTAVITQTVRIDTTPPIVLDLYLFNIAEGRTERLPVIWPGSPLLTSLSINTGSNPFSFVSDPNLQNLNIVYGLYDGESGLNFATFKMTETSFTQGISNYQRTL